MLWGEVQTTDGCCVTTYAALRIARLSVPSNRRLVNVKARARAWPRPVKLIIGPEGTRRSKNRCMAQLRTQWNYRPSASS